MIGIIAMEMIIYLILIAWTWHSLNHIETTKKVALIAIGIILIGILTLIIFQIAQNGIHYPNVVNDENNNIYIAYIVMQKKIRNLLVSIFTGVNGIIIMPQIGRMLGKIEENEMKKEAFQKKVVILGIILLLCLVFEIGYMKDIQEGILKIYCAMR